MFRRLYAHLSTISHVKALGFYSAREERRRKSFIVYVLEVHALGTSWRIYRRYSQFAQLHTRLSFKIPFPPRIMFSLGSRALYKENLNGRCEALFAWLASVTDLLQAACLSAIRNPSLSPLSVQALAQQVQDLLQFLLMRPNESPQCATGPLPTWALPLPTFPAEGAHVALGEDSEEKIDSQAHPSATDRAEAEAEGGEEGESLSPLSRPSYLPYVLS